MHPPPKRVARPAKWTDRNVIRIESDLLMLISITIWWQFPTISIVYNDWCVSLNTKLCRFISFSLICHLWPLSTSLLFVLCSLAKHTRFCSDTFNGMCEILNSETKQKWLMPTGTETNEKKFHSLTNCLWQSILSCVIKCLKREVRTTLCARARSRCAHTQFKQSTMTALVPDRTLRLRYEFQRLFSLIANCEWNWNATHFSFVVILP